MNTILTGSEICKTFGEGEEKRRVLDGVSLHVEQGEFISVMGPSGSGKSTLLFAMSGMDGIDSGKILAGNRDISLLDGDQRADFLRREIGFVFQQPTLLKNLIILENIILPSMGEKKRDMAQIIARAENLMEQTGISSLRDRSTNRVSGGQLQRAGICRALMKEPSIIFADEPTGALDSKSAGEIMDIFSRINKSGTAILLVTLDAKIASRTERICFMKDGRIVDELRLDRHEQGDREERIRKVRSALQKNGM